MRRRRRICVHETAAIKPTIGKNALISGTAVTEALEGACTLGPADTVANCTVGTETKSSSKAAAMAPPAGGACVVEEATENDASGAALLAETWGCAEADSIALFRAAAGAVLVSATVALGAL